MFKRIAESSYKFFSEESLSERSKRMIPGAIYAAIAASLYTVVSAVVNVIAYPDLHLAVNWGGLLIQLLGFALVLALAGVIVGWFSETYEGIVFGGIVIAVLLLAGNYIASLVTGRGATLMGQSILVTILPLVIACMLLAAVIRVAINRHSYIKRQEKPGVRRKLSVQLVGTVALVGFVLGVFALYGTGFTTTLRALNKTMQNYATDPFIESRFPYDKVPGLKDHFGMDYSLYARTSNLIADAIEVTIHFKDGYSVTCLAPQTAGSEALLLDICNEGTSLRSP
jgi:hypothetical protein